MRKIFIIAVMLFISAFSVNSMAKSASIGFQASDFTLVDQNGRKVSLSDYRGKVILLNFWASWCGPCKEEMPLLERLQKERADIVVLAVNTLDPGSRGRRFLEENHLKLHVLFDQDNKVSAEYKIRALPTSLIIDSSFVVQGVFTGAMDYQDMKKFLQEAIDFADKPAVKSHPNEI